MIHGESLQADRGGGGEEGGRRRQHVRAHLRRAHPPGPPTTRRGSPGAVGLLACARTRSTSSRPGRSSSAAGGATSVFRPHAHGEGLGRIWYAPWNTGSAYSLMIQAGAKMTQMEHRLVVARFKDGYGPVGHVVPAVQGGAEERLRREHRAEVGRPAQGLGALRDGQADPDAAPQSPDARRLPGGRRRRTTCAPTRRSRRMFQEVRTIRRRCARSSPTPGRTSST